MTEFSGANVLVTGGGTGIGRAVALALARRGAHVTVAGRRADALKDTCRIARLEELDVVGETVDVTETGSVSALVNSFVARRGKVDGLVNAAGVASNGPTESVSDEDFLKVLDINLAGAFRLSREVGTVMLAASSGSIVHVGSLTSVSGFAGRAAYSASKHGILGLVRSLAAEWGGSGVRVNAVAPGFVRTPMTDRAIDSGALDLAEIEHRTPLGRRAEPEEVVGPVLFLLSPSAAGFVTGACLMVDGGWTASVGLHSDLAAPRGVADASDEGA